MKLTRINIYKVQLRWLWKTYRRPVIIALLCTAVVVGVAISL